MVNLHPSTPDPKGMPVEPLSRAPSTSVASTPTAISRAVLGATERALPPTPVSEKKVESSWSGKLEGMVKGVKRFFERRFSEPKPEERKLAETVNKGIGSIEKALEKGNQISAKARREESGRRGEYPSGETIQSDQKSIIGMKQELNQAEQSLALLNDQTMKAKVGDLADKYVEFDALPGKIESLTRQVQELKGRVELAEKLVVLETCIQKYSESGGSWDKFVAIRGAGADVAQKLTKMIEQREERGLQGYLNKRFTTEDVRLLIRYMHPDLEAKSVHLFAHFRNIQESRIDNRQQEVRELGQLLERFTTTEKNIRYLESRLSDKSWGGKLYRYMFGKVKLEKQLDKTKASAAEWSHQINEKAQFNPEEVAWLGTIPQGERLHQTIKTAVEASQTLVSRGNIYTQLDKLHGELKQYAWNARFSNARTQDFRANIKLDIMDSVRQLADLSEVHRKGVEDKRDLESIRVILLDRFPMLEKKLGDVWASIQSQHLEAELNQALQEELPAARPSVTVGPLIAPPPYSQVQEEGAPSTVAQRPLPSPTPARRVESPSTESSPSAPPPELSSTQAPDPLPREPLTPVPFETVEGSSVSSPPPAPPPPPPPPAPKSLAERVVKQVESSTTREEAKPSSLLEAIKAAQLNKESSEKGRPLTFKEAVEKAKQGDQLDDATFEIIRKGVEKGENISKDDRKAFNLSQTQTLTLALAEKRRFTKSDSDDDAPLSASSDDEWD